MTGSAAALSGKGHRDENFPVASWIVAARHRSVVMAFYRFARAADDVADHASLQPAEKYLLLDRMEAALLGKGEPDGEAEPLRRALADRGLTARHALDLLSAFRQDVEKRRYADFDDLMDYCSRSAMPVGRFVLDVHGESARTWPASDALCAALQIINHLQDCAKDYRDIDRVYLPLDRLAANGTDVTALTGGTSTPGLLATIHDLAKDTAGLLERSASFSGSIRDTRLALEVAAIHGLAGRLVAMLKTRDPLAERVALGKGAAAAVAAGAAARAFAGRLVGRNGKDA